MSNLFRDLHAIAPLSRCIELTSGSVCVAAAGIQVVRETFMSNVSEKMANTVTPGAIAGYFENAEDARRSIDDLLVAGFNVSEIGAAFHDRPHRDSLRAQESEGEPLKRTSGSDDSVAGVASGTSGVTPAGLSTGGGTAFAGASRPAPITGSELPSDLPSELPHELPSDADLRASGRAVARKPAVSQQVAAEQGRRSWRNELEPVFGNDSATKRGSNPNDANMKFGTGEGSLGDISDYPYSGSAFEQSFNNMGIPSEHSRRIAHELNRGGAIVTVQASARNAVAESIMERNHGTIRYEAGPSKVEVPGDSNERVELFGEVHRVYPGFASRDRGNQRKAS
jgi:hypothetical protein